MLCTWTVYHGSVLSSISLLWASAASSHLALWRSPSIRQFHSTGCGSLSLPSTGYDTCMAFFPVSHGTWSLTSYLYTWNVFSIVQYCESTQLLCLPITLPVLLLLLWGGHSHISLHTDAAMHKSSWMSFIDFRCQFFLNSLCWWVVSHRPHTLSTTSTVYLLSFPFPSRAHVCTVRSHFMWGCIPEELDNSRQDYSQEQ